MKIAAFFLTSLLVISWVSGTRANAASVGQPCGEGSVCDKGLWCEPPAGVCASAAGVCVAVPRLCFARKKSRSFKPVCGCNNKTFSSDCFRRAYKIGKSHDGKCDAISATHGGG